jgi:hypothetical protein
MKSEMVSATGAVMNFITVLNQELNRAGGRPEMIYFSQLEHARPMMALIAKTIVKSKLWKIPYSLIEKEIKVSQEDSYYIEYDLIWSWVTFSNTAEGVTTLRFVSKERIKEVDERYRADYTVGIPTDLYDDISHVFDRHTKAKTPCVILWEAKKYVVTYWDDREAIYLAPAENFDLEN